MKRFCILSLSLALLPACSGDDTTGGSTADDGGSDSSVADATTPEDTGSALDTSAPDTGSTPETGSTPPDAEADAGAALDGALADGDASAAPDGGDGGDGGDGCPASWLVAPVVNPSIAVPDGGGGVLLHAVGTGTQDYVCVASTVDSGAPYVWTLKAPDANLTDCHAALIGHHFASEGGAAFPEWQTLDGTYVIGARSAAYTPDGGAGSIAWLLVHAVDAGGTGALSMADYVQRLDTDGGNAPADGCNAGTVGHTTNVPYTADYYFFGP